MAKSKAMMSVEKAAGPLTFGRLLWAIRTDGDKTLAAFAEPLGVSRQRLNDIEKGRETVSAERAAKWAEILGHSPAQFVRLALQAQLDAQGLEQLHVDVTEEPEKPAERPRHLNSWIEELSTKPAPKPPAKPPAKPPRNVRREGSAQKTKTKTRRAV